MSATQDGDSETRKPIDATCHSLAEAGAKRWARWPTRVAAESATDGRVEHNDQSGSSGGSGSSGSEGASNLPPRPSSLIGSRVGACLITKRLGAGGAGEVFKGVDVMLKRDVAIKVLRPEAASDPFFLERFRHEAQILGGLSHPNIVSVHTFPYEGDKQFMVMEYVPGISLDEFIRAGGPVPAERALRIFRRALDGIGHAHHRGIVHRDIKPANIMLAESGQVKVMDFGIARAVGIDRRLTRGGKVPGTARYMSPEQVRGEEVDARSDIYSLGIVLYMLLSGRAPFDGDSDYTLMKSQVEQAPPPLNTLVPNVPLQLEAAVMRALAKNPSERFQTVEAFSRTLDACLAEMLPVPPPAPDQVEAHTSASTVVNAMLSAAPRAEGQPEASPISPAAQAIRSVRSGMAPEGPQRLGRSTAAATAASSGMRPITALLTWLRRMGRRALVPLVLAPLVVGAAMLVIRGAVPESLRDTANAVLVLARAMQSKVPFAAWVPLVAAPSADDAGSAPSQDVQVIRESQPHSPAPPAERLAAGAAPEPTSQPQLEEKPMKPQLEEKTMRPQLEEKARKPTLEIIRLPSGGTQAAEPGTGSGTASAGPGTEVSHKFEPGELIQLLIKPSRDAHVYCYLQNETRQILRFYPNRFSGGSALVTAAAPLQLPGKMGFELVANTLKVKETVACFATERNVMAELPAAVTGTDFENLPVTSLDHIKRAFGRVAGDKLAQASFMVEFK